MFGFTGKEVIGILVLAAIASVVIHFGMTYGYHMLFHSDKEAAKPAAPAAPATPAV